MATRTHGSGRPPGGTSSRALPDLSSGLGQADIDARFAQGSEFSHGPGLVAPGFENAIPVDGGRYRGRTPPTELRVKLTKRRR